MKGFLLDTSVVSEVARPEPSSSVMAWLEARAPETLHLSVITVAELRYGVEKLGAGRKRSGLIRHLARTVESFGPRLLPVEIVVAQRWAVIRRAAERAGRSIPSVDALLAATADVHGLTVVTRNVRDFEVWGGPVFDPWTQTSPS